MDLFSQIQTNLEPGRYYLPELENPLDSNPSLVKLIAFYLPQFHPTAENDKTWGKGFTEWTNVTKALPRFLGHYQPRLPNGLGFYDLRNIESIEEQVRIAKKYGVYGFCFHHYWFDGRPVMRKPIDNFLSSNVEMPFCINWANENWTKNWDGGNREIILSQNHTPEDDAAFIRDALRYIRDTRYIKVENRPLIIVYRPELLPDPPATMNLWRQEVINSGLENPYIVTCHSFQSEDPARFGMDAAVGFPPHQVGWQAKNINHRLVSVDGSFRGQVKEFSEMAANACALKREEYTFFHTVCPSWDNQARQTNRGICFSGATPPEYEKWLHHACVRTLNELPTGRKFVFINAWNEWAEGAYLEPDRHYGYAFLHSTAVVLNRIGQMQASDTSSADEPPPSSLQLKPTEADAKLSSSVESSNVRNARIPLNKIFIATPTYQDKVYTGYMRSVMQISYAPSAHSFSTTFFNATEIHQARNILASMFYADTSCTHLLFIDTDMEFKPTLIEKMLRFDKPFIGVTYPRREVDPQKLQRMSRHFDDPELAETCALEYVGAVHAVLENGDITNPLIRVKDGFIRTHRVGCGIMLLQRSVLTVLRERYPELMNHNPSFAKMGAIAGPIHQCFMPVIDADGEYYSEDIAFCERWRKTGGEIWACVDEEVTHHGARSFRGTYLTKMKNRLIEVPSQPIDYDRW